MTSPSITGTPQAFTFADGGSGHLITYTGGGTANSSTWDVLLINSDTVMSTPSGWTLENSSVGGQGAYVFTKNGGTSSVTITTSGNFAADATWVRITDSSGVDTGATSKATVDGIGGTTTPSLTTPALAVAGSLALAWAALHSFGAAPATYAWSSGYTELINSNTLTSGSVASSVAAKMPAGTAAETPNVTWPSAPPSDRYIFFLAFKPTVGASTIAPDGVAVSVGVGTPALAQALTITPNGVAVTAVAGSPALAQALTITPNGVAVTAGVGTPTVSQSVTPGFAVAPSGVAVTVSAGSPTLTQSLPAIPAGNWNSLLNIMRANEVQLEHEITRRPTQCPNHLYPLDTDITGTYLHCTFGGEMFDLNGHPVYYQR